MICEYCKHPLVLRDGFYIVEDGPTGDSTAYCWMKTWKYDDGGNGPLHNPSKQSIVHQILNDL